jgi:lysophospholipase L1-like esterase
MRYGPPARWYFTGALAIDDARVDAFGPISLQSTWSGVIFNQAEPQLHTHDIWLPHCCGAELLALEVEDGDSLRSAPPFALTWLAYGDSITQGMVGTQPVLTWTSRVARSLNAKLTNVGVGGATLRAELALTVADTPAGLITVSYGGNDWNQDIRASRYGENAQALIAALRRQHPRTPIVLTSPLPCFRRPARNGKGETHTVFRKALESAARGHEQVHVLDGYALLPADEAYYHDGIHPNDPGMTHLAETILDTLQHLGVVPD